MTSCPIKATFRFICSCYVHEYGIAVFIMQLWHPLHAACLSLLAELTFNISKSWAASSSHSPWVLWSSQTHANTFLDSIWQSCTLWVFLMLMWNTQTCLYLILEFFLQFVQINLLGSAANPFACKAGALCFSPFYYLILSLLVSRKFCQHCI